ncbi:uncharacterized protein LOC111052376 [Nilaparvata lugens]|uniref:uncharacterized protein LOC111052376 n=1 Tax=Nilaparvata lugens TaxID=108931 RepID=UPI00193D0675|nr:uncharacterized protein LOC111052376 [Nilaparvata lugens]
MTSGVFYILLGLLGILQNSWSVEGGDASVQSERYLPLHSKPLYYSGDTLIIGSLSKYNSLEETFPDFGDPTCETMESSEYYGNEIYRTNIFNRSSTNNFEVSTAEQNPKVEASEYFVQVGVLAFRCKPKQDDTQSGNPGKRYVQIINSMVSIKEIYEIKYFSGVSVTKSNCGGRECVLVEETKCLAQKAGNADLVQFKCNIGMPSRTSPPSIVPNLKHKYFAKVPIRHRRHFKDMSDAGNEIISSGGKSFKIGSSSSMESSEYMVVCQPSTIMNPRIFFPECFQKVGDKYARMNGQQFDESFTVVDERVQICVNETSRLPQAPKIFYRVQTTVIGKYEVKEIQYGPGISELYAITLPTGKETIRYKDVRFYDGITRERISLLIPFREVENWKVSSIRVGSERISWTDIHFKLEHSSVYSTFISPTGYDLQVGSKPVLDGQSSLLGYSCSEMENSNKFSTEIKLVISRGQENHAVVKDDKDITFSYISKKIWKCSPRTKKGLTFWRIANRLETSMPVHMIHPSIFKNEDC